ncbi:CHASE2 domain-containing protein [Methylobacterium nigriterrae]|uniref:CHASE2 domain-containing protein n=1 Tax=Methylobacterium nigriterrae TaxID=3127512 RepID=UPI003013FC2C
MPDALRLARAAHCAASLALALVVAALVGSWHMEGRSTVLDRIEAPLLDLRFALAGQRPAPPDLVIVALDDAAIRAAKTYPLPRAMIARLLQTLSRLGPRALGLDILFLDPGPEAEDRALAEALKDSGSIIAGAAQFGRPGPDGAAPRGEVEAAEQVIEPTERFRQATAFGLVNLATDHGGTPRHVPLLIRTGDALLPSFALLVAARAAAAEPVLAAGRLTVGTVTVRPDLGLNLPLRYYGPRGTIRSLSAVSVLRGEVGPDAIRGRIVLIGATALGGGDTFASPYDPVLPGVEVLATAIGHLATGDGLVRDRAVRRLDAAAALTLGIGAALALTLAPPALGCALVALAAAAWLGLTLAAFAAGIWLSATGPIVAMAPVALVAITGRLVLDRRAAQRLASAEEALRAFHPPALADRIERDPAFLAEPRAQSAAVVFCDLRGFTQLSERLGPRRTQAFLKGFQICLGDEIARHGGAVMSFMGDGAMSVFGLPEPRPDDAHRALAAACALVPRLRRWFSEEAPEGGALDLRVGAHHGEVVVSRLGAADYQHITVTGDTVNVASRLMEVAKDLGVPLVASQALVSAAGGPECDTFTGHLSVPIRGRQEPVAIAYR